MFCSLCQVSYSYVVMVMLAQEYQTFYMLCVVAARVPSKLDFVCWLPHRCYALCEFEQTLNMTAVLVIRQ